MKAIYYFLSEEAVYALGIMLIHFLWQGIVVAVTLGMFLLILGRSSAQSRYVTSITALFLLPPLALVTFIRELNKARYVLPYMPENIGATDQLAGNRHLFQSFLDLYNSYLPLIVFLWFIGITILLLKNLGALIYIQRLKNYFIKPVSKEINYLINSISKKITINKEIKSYISQKVDSPMIIGHFKPVLLIPQRVISGLSNKEIDVILHHELAHIKRNDYLVNILQTIVEIFFFFHPAVWWISGIVRKEREECCDTFAVQEEADKIVLAKALTSIQELNLNTNNMALTFINKKNGLLNRITSLFGSRPLLPSFREGIVVTVFFFLCILFMSFAGHGTPDPKPDSFKTINTVSPEGDDIWARVDSTGEIKEMFVNDEKIEKEDYDEYEIYVDEVDSNSTNSKKVKKKSGNESEYAVIVECNTDKDYERAKENTKKAQISKKEARKTKEEMEELKKEMLDEFRIVNKEMGLNINVDDDDTKLEIRGDEKEFILNVEEDNEKVRMHFNEDGIYMEVIENGKVVFHMNISGEGLNITKDDDSNEDE